MPETCDKGDEVKEKYVGTKADKLQETVLGEAHNSLT